MPLQTLWSFPQTDRKLRTAPRRQHCAAQDALEQEKEKRISFSPSPCRLFIFFIIIWSVYMSIQTLLPSAASWTGLDDTRRIPRLLKGCGLGGVTVQKALSVRQRVKKPA